MKDKIEDLSVRSALLVIKRTVLQTKNELLALPESPGNESRFKDGVVKGMEGVQELLENILKEIDQRAEVKSMKPGEYQVLGRFQNEPTYED